MKIKTYLFKFTVIFLIAGVGIAAVFNCLSINNTKENVEGGNQLNQSIVESEKEMIWRDILTMDIANTQMISPHFKIGEQYIYHVRINKFSNSNTYNLIEPLSYDSTIYIDDIVKINNTEYYVVREKNLTKSSHTYIRTSDQNLYGIEENITLGGCVIKINKENGKILFSYTFGTRCYLLEDITISPRYYIHFYLNESSKFEFGGQNKDIKDVIELNVIGIEKIENRKCFKVETQRKIKNNNIVRIVEKGIYWVDVDKRIPIKIEKYEDNVLIRSMVLSNINEL